MYEYSNKAYCGLFSILWVFYVFENFIHRIGKKSTVVGNKNLLGLNYANYFYSQNFTN